MQKPGSPQDETRVNKFATAASISNVNKFADPRYSGELGTPPIAAVIESVYMYSSVIVHAVQSADCARGPQEYIY